MLTTRVYGAGLKDERSGERAGLTSNQTDVMFVMMSVNWWSTHGCGTVSSLQKAIAESFLALRDGMLSKRSSQRSSSASRAGLPPGA